MAKKLAKKVAIGSGGVIAKTWKLFEIGSKAVDLANKTKKVVSGKKKRR